MKFSLFCLFFSLFFLASNTQSHAQIGKTISRGIKWFGKTTAEAAVGVGVEYAFKRAFRENNRRAIEISVTNNYNNYVLQFWVTKDGINWTPYRLAPGYYFTAQSGSSGYVGIFTGSQYFVLNQHGNYYASQFY